MCVEHRPMQARVAVPAHVRIASPAWAKGNRVVVMSLYGASRGSQSTIPRQHIVSELHFYHPAPRRRLTSNQPLIQLPQPPHILLPYPALTQLSRSHISVLDDPLLPHTLRQRHEPHLQTPPHQQLRRRALVLLAQLHDHGMLHSQSAGERGVGLHGDVFGGAARDEGGVWVEGVEFDLVDCGADSRGGGEEFGDLEGVRWG